MRSRIILIVAFLLLILSNFGIYYLYNKSQEENTRLKVNQTVLAMNLSSNEVTYTQKEWDRLNADKDSLANSLGIKTKQLNRYFQLYLLYKDSVKVPNIIPSLDNNFANLPEAEYGSDIRAFKVDRDCYSISGVSTPDSTILIPIFKSNVSNFFFWKHNQTPFVKRLFAWDFSKIYSAVSILECSGDTIKVLENINIIKK